MKYDTVRTQAAPEQSDAVRAALGLRPQERVWVAACTWPGEEAICLRVHRRLLKHEPGLRLVIAPRHIERAGEVHSAITSAGFPCTRRSDITASTAPEAVCLLDTVGELGYVYAFAELAFVGKSLTVGGGHNMLEPAALGTVPVFGPLTENFQSEAELLLSCGAAERVADEETLASALLRLLQDAPRRREQARLAQEALAQRRGASARNLTIIAQLLAGELHFAGTEDVT